MRFLRAPLASLFVLTTCLAAYACAAERATIAEDDPDTGSRTLRDSSTPARDGATTEDARTATDSATGADAATGNDATTADASDGAPPRDASVVGVTVSEIFAADILTKRYVELAGPAGTPLGELELRIANGAGAVLKTVKVSNTAADSMPARGTWVVGGILGTSVDRSLLVSDWDLPSDNGTVQLVRTSGGISTVVDVVGYGVAAAQLTTMPNASREGTAAATPGTKALLRKPPQVDTGNNQSDFCAGAPSPNAVNVCDI